MLRFIRDLVKMMDAGPSWTSWWIDLTRTGISVSLNSDPYVLGHAFHHYVKLKNFKAVPDFADKEVKWLRSVIAKSLTLYAIVLILLVSLIVVVLSGGPAIVKNPVIWYSVAGISALITGFVFLPRRSTEISRLFELLILWNQIGHGDLSGPAIEKTLEQIFEIIRTTWSRNEN